jgi:hypothetical protein
LARLAVAFGPILCTNSRKRGVKILMMWRLNQSQLNANGPLRNRQKLGKKNWNIEPDFLDAVHSVGLFAQFKVPINVTELLFFLK